MEDSATRKGFTNIHIDERRLSIIVFALLFSWMLAFPFEGQVLYAQTRQYGIAPHTMVFMAVAAHFCGFVWLWVPD